MDKRKRVSDSNENEADAFDQDTKSHVEPLPVPNVDEDNKPPMASVSSSATKRSRTPTMSNNSAPSYENNRPQAQGHAIPHNSQPAQAQGPAVSFRNNSIPSTPQQSPITKNTDKAPPTPASTSHITLKVVDQFENEVSFRIMKTAPLRKAMYAYCDAQNKDLNSVIFLFEGRHFLPHHTAEDLGIQDGDEIDAMMLQNGGSLLA